MAWERERRYTKKPGEWQRLAHGVNCPHCPATLGMRCMTDKGRDAMFIHVERCVEAGIISIEETKWRKKVDNST